MGSEARTRVALGALLVVTLLSFGQVFDRGDWPGPALLGIAISMAMVVGARRRGISTLWTFVAATGALIAYLALVFRMSELFYGLPTPAALTGIVRSITNAVEKSTLDYAPVPVRTGYVVLTVIGLWVTTVVAEVATFRWRRPLLASFGPIALFSLVTVLGTGEGTTVPVLMFLAALLSYLALESSHRLRSWGAWVASLGSRTHHDPDDVSGRLARRMGASCLAAALFAPVFLPALGDGLLSWRSGQGGSGPGGTGGSVDLLASLQPRLLEQSDAELFEVQSEQADYWRLTSLVDFDGTTWKPLEDDIKVPLAQDQVNSAHPPDRARRIVQRVAIRGLEGRLMPAAVQPTSLRLTGGADPRGGVNLRYEFEMGTVELSTGLTEGLSYEVSSDVPQPAFRELRRTPVVDPAALRELGPRYVDTGPVEISPEVEQLVQRWTGDVDNPFLKLVALQQNLRLFAYDTTVAPSASTDHLTEFLTVTRTGYCQQFAAAFALLARHLGFPARVSVGFLPGSADVAQPDRFVVRGTEAHAWPEVLFEGFGWVRFEPTPGNQAAPPGYTSARRPFFAQNPFSDDPPRGNQGNGNPADLEGNQNVPGGVVRDRETNPFAAVERRRAAWEETFTSLVTGLALALLLGIAAVPLVKTLRTSLRYRRARTPGELAAAAFAHFEAEASELATPRPASVSARTFARSVAGASRIARDNALRLAEIYELATYGPLSLDGPAAAEARRLAVTLRSQMWAAAPLWTRVRRLFSPTPLLSSFTRAGT